MTTRELLAHLHPAARAAVQAQLGKPDAAAAFRTVRSARSAMRCGDSTAPRPRIDPAMRARTFAVDVATPNPLNCWKSWRARSGLRKRQRARTAGAMLDEPRTLPPLPVVVTMVRRGRGTVDDDAVAACVKSIRDQIADAYGLPDNDRRFRFAPPTQQWARTSSVLVTIETLE